MGKIICVSNQKGGVGKTAVTVNIGVALALQGKSVLLVDLDSQGSLTTSLGYNPLNFENSTVTVLSHPKAVASCVYETDIQGLSLIPASSMLSSVVMTLHNKKNSNYQLKWGLDIVRPLFDYILIDTSPVLSPSTLNALIASNFVLVPAETKISSNFGLQMFVSTIQTIQATLNPKLELLGIVATMFNIKASEDKAVLRELKEGYDVLGVIRRATAVSSAVAKGLPCVLVSKRSMATLEFQSIAKKIIKKVEEK